MSTVHHVSNSKKNTGPTSSKKENKAEVAKPAAPVVAAPSEKPAKKKVTYQEKMRKLTHGKRVQAKARNTVSRFAKVAAMVSGWNEELDEATIEVVTALATFLKVANTIPDDFKPSAKERISGLLAGTKVDIRAKVLESYADILDTEETKGLEVVMVKKGRVVVKTNKGSRIITRAVEVGPTTTRRGSTPRHLRQRRPS